MKKLIHHISESGNPRVHWKDPLSDGVYPHSEVPISVKG